MAGFIEKFPFKLLGDRRVGLSLSLRLFLSLRSVGIFSALPASTAESFAKKLKDADMLNDHAPSHFTALSTGRALLDALALYSISLFVLRPRLFQTLKQLVELKALRSANLSLRTPLTERTCKRILLRECCVLSCF